MVRHRDTCSRCKPITKKGMHAAARGYDYQWQQLRKTILDDEPCCVDCEKRGVVRPAEHVHHHVPITDAWHLRLEPSNLVPLCEPCHEERHRGGQRPGVVFTGGDGSPQDRPHPQHFLGNI